MALVESILYCVSNTLYFLWETLGGWIKENSKNNPDRLLYSYTWMVIIGAAVASSIILILLCLDHLSHLKTQSTIAGGTLMCFIQTRINKLELPVIWVWLRPENLLLIPMTCWKYLTWPMQAFPSEGWRRVWPYKEVELDGKLRTEKPMVQDKRPKSSLIILSWSKQQHHVNDWWTSMRQSEKAWLGWRPCIENLKVQSIRARSGLIILGSMIFGVILIFLIWDRPETLSSATLYDLFWAFLNAQI